MFFRKTKTQNIDHAKVEQVVDKLHSGIHTWVKTVLPSLTANLSEAELEILAVRLGQEFK